MLKNVQTTVQLPSFHILGRLSSKSFKLGFNSMWTENFQMYRLGLEKAEEPEIKLPIFVWRKQRNFRKTSTSVSLITLKPLTVWITTNCGKFLEMGVPDHLICLLRNLYVGQEATVRTRCRITDWFKIGKGVGQGCILSPCLFNLNAKWERERERECVCVCVCVCMHSVISDFFSTLQTVAPRLLCSWNFPSNNTGVGHHFLLQGIFPTQWSNLHLPVSPAFQVNSLSPLSHQGSISCEILGWMNHKLESRLLGEISTTSDMQMIPL